MFHLKQVTCYVGETGGIDCENRCRRAKPLGVRPPRKAFVLSSLFEKYGGFAAISKIVMDFYGRVLDSDEIGHFFDDVEMGRQIDHQTKFIAQVLGGPAAYTNEMLRRVHAAHNINRHDFDEVVRLLAASLADHGFLPDDIQLIMTEIEGRARFIINA